MGNTLSITDANGNAITSATHIGNLNMIRYRGYYFDSESGLYYLQSRYYDPQVKRFLNADGYVSTGQGLLGSNMFAYCGNNPVNLMDPTGNIAIEAVLFGIFGAILTGIVALAATTAVNQDAVRSAAVEIELTFQELFYRDAVWEEEQEIVGPQVIEREKPQATAKATEAVAVKEKKKIPQYFEATRVFVKDPIRGSTVIIGKPITYVEAVARVSMGLDVMCLHQGAAIAIAKLYPYNVGPENHGTGKIGIYYDHYHPNRYSHTHIWYLGPTIIDG